MTSLLQRHQSLATGKALGPAVPSSPSLSRAIGCHFWNGLTILHGPPGSAKTALANQLAAEAGCPALIVTCEMDPLELLERDADVCLEVLDRPACALGMAASHAPHGRYDAATYVP